MQKNRHFRAVFDISPVGAIDNPWAALVGEIRAWIARKEKDPLKGFFFKGGSWSGQGASRARVVTRVLSDGGEAPEMWAARYEHADSSVKARRWLTDIGVTRIGPAEWRLAMEVSHALRSDYIGREPLTPDPSSPRLIVNLLESKNWVARVGSTRLLSQPKDLKVGEGAAFVTLLTDAQRLIPVVLVSCDRKSGAPRLDSRQLSRALAGTGLVVLNESPECDDELEHLVPMRFRSPNGTVRIYAPGVDFDKEWSADRHRFFTGREIDDQGDEQVIGHIVRALTRSDAWRGLHASIASIDDIDARVRERRLAELRDAGTVSLKEKNELLKLYEEDNEKLTAQKRQLEESLEASRSDADALRDQLARKDFELVHARQQLEGAKREALEETDALKAVLGLDDWPNDPTAVALLAEKVSRGRLVITAQALSSLKRSSFGDFGDACSVLWRCLRAMAEHLSPLLSTEGPSAQQIAEHFKNQTQFDLTWTESKETKRDGKFVALRKLTFEGQEVDMTPHVKWGNKAPKCLRVHFWVEPQTSRIVIGHCGDHLDTAGTRRR